MARKNYIKKTNVREIEVEIYKKKFLSITLENEEKGTGGIDYERRECKEIL